MFGSIHALIVYANGVVVVMMAIGGNTGLNGKFGNPNGQGWGGIGGIFRQLGNTYFSYIYVDIVEVLVFNAVVDDIQCQQVIVYFAIKYGLVICGDGILDEVGGEQCDDGGTDDGDGCSSTCQFQGNGTELGSDLVCSIEVMLDAVFGTVSFKVMVGNIGDAFAENSVLMDPLVYFLFDFEVLFDLGNLLQNI